MLTLICVVSFLTGIGSDLVYLAVVDVVARLFSINSIAPVMLLLSIIRDICVSTYMLIYYLFFYGDGTPISQDPCGYFIMLAVFTLSIHIVVYSVYKLHDTIPIFVKEENETLEDKRKNRDSANDDQGAVSIRKTVLLGMAIPMLKIRRPTGRLIFNMGIPIPGKTVFLIETGPCMGYCPLLRITGLQRQKEWIIFAVGFMLK